MKPLIEINEAGEGSGCWEAGIGCERCQFIILVLEVYQISTAVFGVTKTLLSGTCLAAGPAQVLLKVQCCSHTEK